MSTRSSINLVLEAAKGKSVSLGLPDDANVLDAASRLGEQLARINPRHPSHRAGDPNIRPGKLSKEAYTEAREIGGQIARANEQITETQAGENMPANKGGERTIS